MAFRGHALDPKPSHSQLMSFTQENALNTAKRGYTLLTLATTVGGNSTDRVKNMGL